MRVRIDAGGRLVEVETADANLSPADVLGHALSAWRATEGAPRPSAGPAIGFTVSNPMPAGLDPVRRQRPVLCRCFAGVTDPAKYWQEPTPGSWSCTACGAAWTDGP